MILIFIEVNCINLFSEYHLIKSFFIILRDYGDSLSNYGFIIKFIGILKFSFG